MRHNEALFSKNYLAALASVEVKYSPLIAKGKEMAIPHAKPGEVVDVQPLGSELSGKNTWTIVKTDSLEVIRIVLPAGKELAAHKVPGEITVLCLEGEVEFGVGNLKRELTAGKFLYLAGDSEHSLRARLDSSLLVTILLQHKRMGPVA
jgi:quercetin dioxygenase-like cupin family protein